MPNLSIKDVPEALAEKLRQRAARNHRSLQGELMALLDTVADDATTLAAAEPAATYAASRRSGGVLKWPAAGATGSEAANPLNHEEYVRKLREIACQVNPDFRAADRLSREQTHDHAFLRKLGI